MKKYLSFILLFVALHLTGTGDVQNSKRHFVYSCGETDGYRKERCKLDVYYPVGKKDFPTIVWFHGGD